jgi:hypothetical protein
LEKKSILTLSMFGVLSRVTLKQTYLRLSYSEDLKTKNNHKSGSLRTLPQYLDGRRPQQAVMEGKRTGHRPAEFKARELRPWRV